MLVVSPSAIDAPRKPALVAAELVVREVETLQRCIPPGDSRRHQGKPVGVGGAGAAHKCLQFVGICRFLEHPFAGFVRMQVHQPQQLRRFTGQREHPGIELQLRQIQVSQVLVQRARIDTRGLDLLHHATSGVPAIHPPRHLHAMPLSGNENLAPIAIASVFLPLLLPRDPLLGQRCLLVAVMDVATPMHEGGKVTHANGPAQRPSGRLHRSGCGVHAFVACGCLSRNTRTGSPARSNAAIQRCWFTCSRSPGPFTSTNS